MNSCLYVGRNIDPNVVRERRSTHFRKSMKDKNSSNVYDANPGHPLQHQQVTNLSKPDTKESHLPSLKCHQVIKAVGFCVRRAKCLVLTFKRVVGV